MPFNNCETVCFFRIGIECNRGEQKLIELMRAVQYSTVQYSTVQYSTVKYCTVRAYKYRTVRTIVQYSTVRRFAYQQKLHMPQVYLVHNRPVPAKGEPGVVQGIVKYC